MPHMKHLANRTVKSTTGHTLVFEAGKALYVAPEAVGDAQAAGAVICDNSGVVDTESAGHQVFAVAADLRRSIVTKIIIALREQNDLANFDGGGNVKVAAVKQASSLDTNKEEIDELTTLIKKSAQEKTTIEYHPNTDLALEALTADTREDLKALAKKYPKLVSKEALKQIETKTMVDAKSIVVNLLSGAPKDAAIGD